MLSKLNVWWSKKPMRKPSKSKCSVKGFMSLSVTNKSTLALQLLRKSSKKTWKLSILNRRLQQQKSQMKRVSNEWHVVMTILTNLETKLKHASLMNLNHQVKSTRTQLSSWLFRAWLGCSRIMLKLKCARVNKIWLRTWSLTVKNYSQLICCKKLGKNSTLILLSALISSSQ